MSQRLAAALSDEPTGDNITESAQHKSQALGELSGEHDDDFSVDLYENFHEKKSRDCVTRNILPVKNILRNPRLIPSAVEKKKKNFDHLCLFLLLIDS